MVVPLDKRPRSGPYAGITIRSAKRLLTEQFRSAGLPFPDNDALELVMAVTDLDASELILKETEFISPDRFERLSHYTRCRLLGEPVDHILGWREFYGRKFHINRDVLSPRDDTTVLIERALTAMKDIDAPRILDLGTGSGAILITLLAERPDASAIGIDISQAALNVAAKNAQKLGVDSRATWLRGDWFTPLDDHMAPFDIIVSNPPYIDADAMQQLEVEVKDYDPHMALYGGTDGLEAYRQILRLAATWLAPKGWIGLEIGFDQDRPVRELLRTLNFRAIESYKDLGGRDRVVCAQNATITNS